MTQSNKATNIVVGLPLPMDVAGTVMKLIGTAYPNASISNGDGGMNFSIPYGDRPREIPEDFVPETQLENPADVLSFGPDENGDLTLGVSTPADLASVCLEVMRTSFEENPDALNYLETKCYDRESHDFYIMTFQRGKGKTPHEMRQLAEKKLAEANAELDVLRQTEAPAVDGLALIANKKELKALPDGSIIQRTRTNEVLLKEYGTWIMTGTRGTLKSSEVISLGLGPFTLLAKGKEQ